MENVEFNPLSTTTGRLLHADEEEMYDIYYYDFIESLPPFTLCVDARASLTRNTQPLTVATYLFERLEFQQYFIVAVEAEDTHAMAKAALELAVKLLSYEDTVNKTIVIFTADASLLKKLQSALQRGGAGGGSKGLRTLAETITRLTSSGLQLKFQYMPEECHLLGKKATEQKMCDLLAGAGTTSVADDGGEMAECGKVQEWNSRVTIDCSPPGGKARKDSTEARGTASIQRTLAEHRHTHLFFFCDGSHDAKTKLGGYAAVLFRSGAFAGVFAAAGTCERTDLSESRALQLALDFFPKLFPDITCDETVTIFTDRQNLLHMLEKGPAYKSKCDLSGIHTQIKVLTDKWHLLLRFLFIFSHCGVPSNVLADRMAEDVRFRHMRSRSIPPQDVATTDEAAAPSDCSAILSLQKKKKQR